MSSFSETIPVACPYHLAREYLADAMRAPLEKPSVVTVHAPFLGVDVTKDVLATVSAGADPMHFDQPWKVHWSPVDGGPYPDFDGEITVRADEDYTTCLLEIQGEYRPPGGAAGEAFDAIAGRNIAKATARELLERIARNLVAHYDSLQAAKHA